MKGYHPSAIPAAAASRPHNTCMRAPARPPIRVLTVFACVLLLGMIVPGTLCGELEPPAPPAPTMKTLAEAEPRTPIRPADVPYVISESGSYYLTGNITCSSSSNCIEVEASGVSIDLMGFEIANGETGIYLGSNNSVTIRNGNIRGSASNGIQGSNATGVRLIEVACIDNGGWGASTGEESIVETCRFSENQSGGLSAGNDSLVTRTVSTDNDGNGFRLGYRTRLTDSTSNSNEGVGIAPSPYSVVMNSTAASNRAGGIDPIHNYSEYTVENCTVRNNVGDGIVARSRCRILNNYLYGHAPGSDVGSGIHVVGTDNRIEGNHVIGNDTGIQAVGTGNVIVRNSASGNGTNYDFAAGNDAGPIGSAATASSPWANIVF